MIPVLKDDLVTLTPFTGDDVEYLVQLRKQYKYNKLSDDEARNLIPQYGKHFWKGSTDGVDFGVVWLSYIPMLGGWQLDSYRDDRLVKTLKRDDYSYRSGKLILDYFFNNIGEEISTYHDKRSRAANIALRKLGFKCEGHMVTPYGDMVIFKQRRSNG